MKIWLGRKFSLRTELLWMVDGAIEPIGDDAVELSMKAPMSVSKLADLGSKVTRRQGRRCLARFGPS